MGFSSFRRLLTLSAISSRNPNLCLSNSATADRVCLQLRGNSSNPEAFLSSIKPGVDPPFVQEVVKRLSAGDILLGLRFFVWAGIQHQYKHSSYMYSKACGLLGITQNPRIILELLEAYRDSNCVVGAKMFNVILSLCKEGRLLDEGLHVLGKMPEFGVHPNTNAYNIVIGLSCEAHDADRAWSLLNEMKRRQLYPTIVTYVLMIKGLCSVRRLDDARGLLKMMRANGCLPNVVVYSALLDGISRLGSAETALELLAEMEAEGGVCAPNVITYTSVIQSFCAQGKLSDAFRILDKMTAGGCSPNRVTVSALIECLCVSGRVAEACGLVDRISGEEGVSLGDCYSSLVVCLIRLKKAAVAEDMFRQCLSAGVKLDGVSCSLMMKELCHGKRFLDGFNLAVEIEKSGWITTVDSDVYPLLLLGLCEGNFTSQAKCVAKLMQQKGLRLSGCDFDKLAEILKNFREGDELMAELSNAGLP